MNHVTGKVVLISGASSGIGEATAKRLAQAGMIVFLGARRLDRLQTIVQEIKAQGGQAECMKLDVCDESSVQHFVAEAYRKWNHIDVFINNAGVMLLSAVRDGKIHEWKQMVDINLNGVLNCTAAVLPLMRKQGKGLIINVDSTAGYRVMEHSAIYSATKFAIRAFSDGLRKEETNAGIKVTVIAPGPTDTELLDHISDPHIQNDLQKYVDQGGMQAEDVAETFLFAISMPDHVSIDELIISPCHKL